MDMGVITLPRRCVVVMCGVGECWGSGYFELRGEVVEQISPQGFGEYNCKYVRARDLLQFDVAFVRFVRQEVMQEVNELAALGEVCVPDDSEE